MRPALLETLGYEVGKHLSLPSLLPLRAVCKDWRDTVTLATPEAELDLVPDARAPDEHAPSSNLAHFYDLCPGVTSLTYHVSPRVCPSKFEAAMAELAARLPGLTHLALCFNNAAQQLETRHLRAVTRLPALARLSIQASFHPDACDFSVLAALPALTALRVVACDGASGLTDAHVASLGALSALEDLEFPGAGAPRSGGFTGATLAALAPLARLRRLAVLSGAKGGGDYALAPAALAALASLTRRAAHAPSPAPPSPSSSPSSSSSSWAAAAAAAASSAASAPPPPLDLEICVPDAGWVAAVFRTAAPEGLGRLSVSVREPVGPSQLAALAALPPRALAQLTGLEAELRGALDAADVAALGALTGLERLALSCRCSRAAAERFDLRAWAGLSRLRSFHLHVNPAWRQPLAPATLAALARAWPRLEHLHLRLCAADNATRALAELRRFGRLASLSLQWLGEPATLERSWSGGRRRSIGGAAAAAAGVDAAAAAVLDLGALPPALRSLSATCISAVRIHVPGSGCGDVGGGGASPPPLTALSLDGNFGMSDELLSRLALALPRLRRLALVLAGRQALSCEGLRAVGSLRDLTALLVADYRDAPLCLHQGCLLGLAESLRRLRSLKLSTHDIVHHELRPEVFAGFSKLRRLELVGCADQAAEVLGPALPLCCMRPSPEWAEEPAAAALKAATAAA